ncbi:DUF2249 domain-containing protein [Aquibacillus kalidii]|uniref:DUF2249 domain-containing protein n=1 Tax=Aquibacillus kalidii TaxID=2762597 RepID=UPI0016453E11|nr:DUF2249 domain-containing protein [Aquibacillus kalidii]
MSDIKYAEKIYAPDIDPKYRHPRIFEIFDGLGPGERMELTNDHDPKPLYYQFMIERENLFTWNYLDNGPDIWRVSITKK